MEIVIAVVVIGLVGYWAYTHFNKEKTDGSHVLDTLTKAPEPIAPAPVSEHVRVEAVAPVEPATKAKRAPTEKKPRAPAKPRTKKTPAK